MYTLRTITEQNLEINQSLGDNYNIIDRFKNYEHYCRCFQFYFKREHVADLDESSDSDTKNVYGFIGYGPYGETLQPIYINQSNYIMTESGKTFSKIS